jgi:hypothetical protein
MRERLLTLLCALGALFLFGTIFLSGSALNEERAAPPTTLERSANGLFGALTWLRTAGVRTVSLRERFGALAHRQDLPAAGNLVIVSLPAATAFRNDELVALDRWIRAGNTLLVLAALLDRPSWARYPFMLSNDLRQLTGLSEAAEPSAQTTPGPAAVKPAPAQGGRRAADAPHEVDADPAVAKWLPLLGTPQRDELVPNRAHPYFAGVSRAVAFSDYAPMHAGVGIPHDGFALALAHERSGGRAGFWVRPLGSGTVVISAFSTLFANRALGEADNARLLANLIGATVSPQGAVIFDDEHQGLSLAYDPEKFFADPRLYATVAVIAAVWLAWVLGGTQLRMPNLRTPAPREIELVRVTGVFLARVVRPAAAARRLLEHFLGRLQAGGARGRTDEAAVWQWLESHPRLERADIARLRQWYSAACAGQRVPLITLHNLIVRTERQLAA